MYNEQIVEETFELAVDALMLLGNHYVEDGLTDDLVRPPVIKQFRDGWKRARTLSTQCGIPIEIAWESYKRNVISKTITDVELKMKKDV